MGFTITISFRLFFLLRFGWFNVMRWRLSKSQTIARSGTVLLEIHLAEEMSLEDVLLVAGDDGWGG